ncbi:MAG: GNAT family N-acetyltransferase [Saprospiraceae bacterium]|nr:GNAT family N-acetyltransferase [Saprospiraceae bacterium]
MLQLLRTNSEHSDFISLVKLLDADLKEKDGEDHSFYAQFNKIDLIRHAILAYWEGIPVGCGAIKAFDADTMEVKRMYVEPAFRGKQIATKILVALENWAKELAYTRCVLETGKRQPEAIALYTKNNYVRIPNYGQYKNVENSVCFEKMIL